MEQFNPDIRITAIGESDAVVTFDSNAAHDYGRASKAVRVPRAFDELSVKIDGFSNGSEVGDKKEFRGTIKLVLRRGEVATEYLLAEPALWVSSTGKRRNAYQFPSAEQVVVSVRQGCAVALGRAISTYLAKESHLDLLSRAPAWTPPAVADTRAHAAPVSPGTPMVAFEAAPPPAAANDEQAAARRHRRNLIAAAVAPVVVFGLLWSVGAVGRSSDPIQEAVARSMMQDPSSTQAQVELTKETLKQMGLDPGASGDIGCLSPE